MKLKRETLMNFEKEWIESNTIEGPERYIPFLDGISEIISKAKAEADDRFTTYGRRDFLRQEFSDYLNKGDYSDAFEDLAEYYSGNTWISMSSVPEGLDLHKIDDDDVAYRKEGIICKQEADIINEMIQEFRDILTR